ncbi:MAG: DNA polymerase III subunit beta [Clostridia bacterium]|nr:DNA polymerase III subunit beta [Clostridia bacterium]
MKIRVKTDELKNAVQTVIPALAVKSEAVSTKVYEFIYISAENCSITLKCCNLNMQIETEIAAFTETDGEILLPGKLFAEIVAKLPADETVLEKQDDTVKIISGAMNMKLQSLPAAEFEGIKAVSSENEIRIEEGLLKKMVLQTSPFALQDNTRPVLKGVLVEVFENELNMVALDPLKFAMRTEKIENLSNRDTQIIIPSKLFESAVRVLSDSNELVKLIFSRQSLTISANNTTIIMLKLDGTYIDYNALIPKNYETRVKMNRKEFISIIERAYLVARDDNKNTVKFIFENDYLEVSVDNEIGSVKDRMDVFISGNDISICFNIKFFIDVMKNIEDDEICMEMTQPGKSCVIKPVEGKSFCYLVVPILMR